MLCYDKLAADQYHGRQEQLEKALSKTMAPRPRKAAGGRRKGARPGCGRSGHDALRPRVCEVRSSKFRIILSMRHLHSQQALRVSIVESSREDVGEGRDAFRVSLEEPVSLRVGNRIIGHRCAEHHCSSGFRADK